MKKDTKCCYGIHELKDKCESCGKGEKDGVVLDEEFWYKHGEDFDDGDYGQTLCSWCLWSRNSS